ncbi:carbohydrate ABC transporter permease [Herbiconiux sp. P16]|uniref:carbohydrate ABC transporter permease n=1 Tax=Herbiconiux wuyangfengii TaxID=3342794 RepID=UPI003CF18857
MSLTERRELLGEVLMAGPAVVLVGLFVLIPIAIAVFLSFTNWNGFTDPVWIGARNYERLFQDPAVLSAGVLTGIITVFGTVFCNVIGLGVALLVSGSSRFNSVIRVLAFYPYVIGPVIIGFLWAAILGSNGAINSLLDALNQQGLPFLSDPTWAVASLIGVIVWSGFGVNVILYIAGLQTIPDSLIEAARIDGATPWQIFWRVKLPMLAPTVTVNVVLVVVSLLRVYEVVLALTNGGPAGSTQTVVFTILSTSFNASQLGYGAAQSVILLIVIVGVTIGITTVRRKSEEAVSA